MLISIQIANAHAESWYSFSPKLQGAVIYNSSAGMSSSSLAFYLVFPISVPIFITLALIKSLFFIVIASISISSSDYLMENCGEFFGFG
jgi:hypothetical protein